MTTPRPAEPRHHSERRPGTRTHGPRIARISHALGKRPFIPWQHRAADLFGEFDPATGLLTRSLGVLTVQRQAGKTELVKAMIVDRCLFHGPAQRVWYTAQKGDYARDQWAAVVTELSAKGSPLAGLVAAIWSKGSEVLTFPNGSTFRPFPPTRDALHSKQTDLVLVDEAWRHDPVRGAEIMQAISPTQQNRVKLGFGRPQTILLSTMGTADSTWWHSWVDKGRAGDPTIGAYIEYGIGDAGDPDDLDAVVAAHPAIPYLTDREFLAGERGKMAGNEFARAYGNARTATDQRFIDLAAWRAASTADAPTGRLVLAFDAAPDRSRSAIVAVAGAVAEVIDSRPGVEWLPDRMHDLAAKWTPAAIIVDKGGPAAPLADRLERAGLSLELTAVGTADYAAACVQLTDALAARTVRYRQHPALDLAADAAVPRPVGDGMWAWGRRKSGGPICEIVALTLALWGDAHRPAPPLRPVVYAG